MSLGTVLVNSEKKSAKIIIGIHTSVCFRETLKTKMYVPQLKIVFLTDCSTRIKSVHLKAPITCWWHQCTNYLCREVTHVIMLRRRCADSVGPAIDRL